MYLKLLVGDLSFLGKNWREFYVLKDCIEAPNGEFLYYWECYTIKYLYQAADRERFRMARVLAGKSNTEIESAINFKLRAIA